MRALPIVKDKEDELLSEAFLYQMLEMKSELFMDVIVQFFVNTLNENEIKTIIWKCSKL